MRPPVHSRTLPLPRRPRAVSGYALPLMSAPTHLTGRYGGPLARSHKASLLAEQAGERSPLQEEVARQFLESVTWIVDLRDDGTFESIWEVGHGSDMAPIPGHWTADAEGRLKLMFADEAAWVGTITHDVLRFAHPDVGEVEMRRLDA